MKVTSWIVVSLLLATSFLGLISTAHAESYSTAKDENVYLAAILMRTHMPNKLYVDGKMYDCMEKEFALKIENKNMCTHIAKKNVTKITKLIESKITSEVTACNDMIKYVKEETEYYLIDPSYINDLKSGSSLSVKDEKYFKGSTYNFIDMLNQIEQEKKETMEQLDKKLKNYLIFHQDYDYKIKSIKNLSCETFLKLIVLTKSVNYKARDDFDSFSDVCKTINELRQCTIDYSDTITTSQGIVIESARKNNITLPIEFEALPKINATKSR